jgi:hypothetical protein
MAAKAGQVVAGFGKVEDALNRNETAALIHASDGAADGIRKLDAIVRQRGEKRGESPVMAVVNVLTSEELDLALGRSNVIHAALKSGAASEAFLERCRRLALYRGATGGNSPLESEENLGSGVVDGPVEAGADDRN